MTFMVGGMGSLNSLTIEDEHGRIVADIINANDDCVTDEMRRNAQKFAAAPDMLAALNKCDTAFVACQAGQIPGRPEDILALITEVRAAIAKAEQQ